MKSRCNCSGVGFYPVTDSRFWALFQWARLWAFSGHTIRNCKLAWIRR